MSVPVSNTNRITALTLISVLLLLTAAAQAEASLDSLQGQDFLPRLFVAPAGRILPSGIVNAAFGGSFASQGGHEYLGLISIGLGGVAEFEFSTAHLVTNVFNVSEPIGTTALKIKLYAGGSRPYIPTVVAGLRANQWSEIENDDGDVFVGPAQGDDYRSGEEIYRVDFETHMTNLYLASTFDLSKDWVVHFGGTWSEYKIRDIIVNHHSRFADPQEQREAMLCWFGGVEHAINERTHSIVEAGTTPQLKFDEHLIDADLSSVWYVMAGVRYFIGQQSLSSFDAGIRYRSNYSGLADAEIRAGLNIGIDVGKEIVNKLKHPDKKRS